MIEFHRDARENTHMTKLEHIEKIASQVGRILPLGNETIREDIQQNLKAGLTAALERMDLVTREEFDVQTALLTRTRERLNQLEKQLSELEELHNQKNQ